MDRKSHGDDKGKNDWREGDWVPEGETGKRGKARSAPPRGRMIRELEKLAFAPLGETEKGGVRVEVKIGDKLKAIEMLAKLLALEDAERMGDDGQENPLAGLTVAELRKLAWGEDENEGQEKHCTASAGGAGEGVVL